METVVSNMKKTIYATSLALLTDLYQLTMAYGYWKTGRADREAVFHLFFRKNPFQGGRPMMIDSTANLLFWKSLVIQPISTCHR